MQFPAWLVSRIRKPILVISIVVAMASLLIACGETYNQGQTTSGETANQGQTTFGETANQGQTTSTSVSLDDAMSAIDDQRQQSYTAVQQIYTLEQNHAFQGCTANYYVNAKVYYALYVRSNFNAWLESLASEEQNGATLLNTSPDDPSLLSNALRANYAFTTWANQVNNYFTVPTNSCSQGQGGYLIATFPKVELPPEVAEDFSTIDLSSVYSEDSSLKRLKLLGDALGYIRSSLDQNNTPTPPGGYSTPPPSGNDLLGAQAQAIRSHEWQDFCGAAQASSC